MVPLDRTETAPYLQMQSWFISALHGMPARTSDERDVRLSVCLCHTRALWQNGRKICL